MPKHKKPVKLCLLGSRLQARQPQRGQHEISRPKTKPRPVTGGGGLPLADGKLGNAFFLNQPIDGCLFITHLINEMPEVSAKLKNNPLSQRNSLLNSSQPQAIALNYILEFLHNFQRNSNDLAMLNALDKGVLAECLMRSIPPPTTAEPAEHTIAEAIKASVRRLESQDDSFKPLNKVSSL